MPLDDKAETVKLENMKMMIDFKETEKFYKYNKHLHVHCSREKAIKILHSFNAKKFDDIRDDLPSQNSTNLGSYFKFGSISRREAYHYWEGNGGVALQRQLIANNFYVQLGFFSPHVLDGPLHEKWKAIEWNNDDEVYSAWCQGRTGYPVVDASMLQMNKTGYMNYRSRMIVSNFLIKNLRVNWQKGEEYFAKKLIDYDPFVNNLNWQWASSTGANSQPYFRSFNPWLQSAKFDKDGTYIKRYLPNLVSVAATDLHKWDQAHTKYSLKKLKYFEPIVDYKQSKAEGLNMYKTALELRQHNAIDHN